ncbi:MAG: hypothetical protein GY737_03285 [Desulfobacteraceae bacterium]|nr:hypothetical protein [Desulfobacteraceae bacterium]
MEWKSLVLGIGFTIAAFAMKSGAGMHYYLSAGNGLGRARKTGFLAACCLIYLILFSLAFLFISNMDMTAWYDPARSILESGMAIHFSMAGVMLLWGLVLLIRRGKNVGATRGWMLMVLPCPLCSFVIVFTMATLAALFPGRLGPGSALFFLGFMAVQYLTMGVLHLARQRFIPDPDTFLAWFMAGTAAYFLVSITVIPGARGMENIYRLACAPPKVCPDTLDLIAMWGPMAGLMATGYALYNSKGDI